MIESQPCEMQETTGPLIEGWDLIPSKPPVRAAERSDRIIENERKEASRSADAWFRLGNSDEGNLNLAAPITRTVAPSQPVRSPAIRFPSRGDVVGGFRVVKELGRGAFARVYLAEQTELAGRAVAIKVAEALGDEPQALAKLQHTHIVPIHSVHDDPATGLRLLCMPYVGGANLAQVLERSGAADAFPFRGTELDRGAG